MKVGIVFSSSADPRYSGANQTAILLGEVFLALGHDVTFIDTASVGWWANVPRIQGTSVEGLYEAEGLEVLLDVDGIVAPEQRKIIAGRTIVFLRSFVQFMEMDAAVYPEVPYVARSMKEVHEIWCWDLLNPVETLPSIQTLFPCPIRRVPFVWSSSITDWMSQLKRVVGGSAEEWTIHIAEKNTHNTSSSVLPLVAVRELASQRVIVARYLCHNMEALLENRFLKENVLHNIEIGTLPVTFVPKASFSEWIQEPSHALFSHTRFLPLRTSLIQALWMGLPLIHNSPVLRDLHPILAHTYYQGNHIQGIANAFQWLRDHATEWYAAEAKDVFRVLIGKTWGVSVHLEAWRTLTLESFAGASAAPVAIKTTRKVTWCDSDSDSDRVPVAPVASAVHVASAVPVESAVPVAPVKTIRIGFSDMWPGFNADSNFIMDALRHEDPSRVFRGVHWSSGIEAHLLIAGPFGTSWKDSSLPVVFFTAESAPSPDDPRIRLHLTSSPKEDETHMRIPTWMTFIDWYTDSTVLPADSQDNPIRLPVHFATHSHPIPFEARTGFCAFVVSNPTCAMRNEAFHALHAYRPVTSGGGLFNNIGGPLALKYPGGGSGDLSKHHFFSQHRFSLSFENAQVDGYITEKVLHAKMAGCLPLYWGDVNTDSDFAPNALLNLSRLGSASQIVGIVQQLESNPAVCSTIAATPLLNEEKKEKALAILRTMSQRLLALLVPSLSNAPSTKFVTNPLARLSKAFVINLDSRRDRWDSLVATEPELAPFLTRLPAVYGKTLTLNPFLYRLFEHNRFQWKKSVMACFLSHISAWSAILQEKEETPGYYLILEDDVRFRQGWKETWALCATSIPVDADLLYLGGVLPPNLPALPLAIESVDPHWSRIKPNTLFSSVLAPVFHFCAYSYVLTRRGAERLLAYLTQSDARASIECDHLIGHPLVGLVKYVTNPLLTYCYQESDPTYVGAAFNEIMKEQTFDSDIQNNADCFTKEELAPFQENTVVTGTTVSSVSTPHSSRIIYYDVDQYPNPFLPYEQRWLEDIMGRTIDFLPCRESTLYTLPSSSWFVILHPHSEVWNARFTEMNRRKRDFYVLHLSDEFVNDCIAFYDLPHCKGVLRNYARADLPALSRVLTLPLGYHFPYTETVTPFADRPLLWSFHGTNWFNRKAQLERIAAFVPYNCLLTPSWNHASMTKEKDYMNLLGKTKFCPILRGNNIETFRLYEALEAGCLPLAMEADTPFVEMVERELNLTSLYAWKDPVGVLQRGVAASVQEEVIRRWNAWKERIRAAVRGLL